MIPDYLYSKMSQAGTRVARRSNTIGYGRCIKVVKNQTTSRHCLCFFVKKKHKDIEDKEKIPATIRVENKRWKTDVISLGQLRLESPNPPRHLRCDSRRGAAGLYASRNDQYFAVSCSHVLKGENSIIAGEGHVDYYESGWQYLGQAITAHEDLGYGISSDWGAFDGGLATVDSPQLLSTITSLPESYVFDHQQDPDTLETLLLNAPVYAVRGNGKRIDAQILGILINNTGRDLVRLDLLIRHYQGRGLTRQGDSGIIWRLSDGTPLAMHFGGYSQNSQGVSTISAAFFIARLKSRFNVNLIDNMEG